MGLFGLILAPTELTYGADDEDRFKPNCAGIYGFGLVNDDICNCDLSSFFLSVLLV